MEEKSPLMDHLLLQQTFSNLTTRELKVARCVCRIWGEEGALNLRHRALSIHVNPPHMTYASRMSGPNMELKIGAPEERRALRDFLTGHKLPHTLHLSLLDFHPWLDNTFRFHEFYIPNSESWGGGYIYNLPEPFSQQQNNYDFATSLLSNYLPQTAPLLKELRLELMLKEEKDFKLLEQILEAVETGLEVLSLDTAAFNPQLLQTIGLSKDHKGSKIKTVAIRLVPRTFERLPGLEPPGPLRLLSLFPNVSFLDLIGWRTLEEFSTRQIMDKTRTFLDAARELGLKLDGIHVSPETEGDYASILNYCKTRPLRSFYLNVYWGEDEDISTFETLEEILGECGASLEKFDLTWRPTGLGRHPLRLPQLQKLKSLTYASKFVGVFEPGYDEVRFDDYQLQDMQGFRELFAEGGRLLNLKLPALESLSIILVELGEQTLWEKIFPANIEFVSSKIQTLVISLAGECESEEIQKFPRALFPKLRHFRHGKWKDDGDKLYVCHHEYDAERRLIRKWSWLAAVKKFMGYDDRYNRVMDKGNYFWTIREKFRARLGDDGFWDTGNDVEWSKLHYGASY